MPIGTKRDVSNIAGAAALTEALGAKSVTPPAPGAQAVPSVKQSRFHLYIADDAAPKPGELRCVVTLATASPQSFDLSVPDELTAAQETVLKGALARLYLAAVGQ